MVWQTVWEGGGEMEQRQRMMTEQQIEQRGRTPSPKRRPAGYGPDPFQVARSSRSQRLAGLNQAGLPKPLGEAIVNVAQAPTDVVDA